MSLSRPKEKLVMPRSRRYGDLLRRIYAGRKYPHIYAKHLYMQESEYESTVVIYIPAIIAQIYSYHGV